MEGKDTRRHQPHGGRAEHFECHEKYEKNHAHVGQQVGQMESPGSRPEKLVAKQISQRHHGTVVVGGPAEITHERPYRRSEDLPQVMEIPQVRIAQDLVRVVVDKAIAQGVEIRENCEGHWNEEMEGV